MNDLFLKVAAATPDIRVADPDYNTEHIIECMQKANTEHAKLLVLPELCLTGYTCGDLFLQKALLDGAISGLNRIRKVSANMDMMTIVGLPFSYMNRLYNVAAVVFHGEVICLIPNTFIPNYSEFYEARHFTAAPKEGIFLHMPELCDEEGLDLIWFGSKTLFQADNMPGLILGAEICEDLWTAAPPSTAHALHGATVIVNLSASDETTGKDIYRRELVTGQSARL